MSLTYFKQQIMPVKDKLYRLALRIMADDAEAQDVVQEVLVKAWKQQEVWPTLRNVEAWCMKLTKNHAIDKIRSRHQQGNLEEPSMRGISTDAPSPLAMAEHSDTMAHLTKIMQQLPEKQRIVMHLRDIEELSYQEIADMLEMPMNQVKVNLFRARNQVRTLYLQTEKHGL
ncbi:MAG: RNA polymerase sigma factor [Saprospiraceae bacterium]|nr:RNA polymerase sigma factor [Saprospiraceae bacterium]